MKILSRLRSLRTVLPLLAIAVTTFLPSTASALDPAHVPSIGADTGRFNFPIRCEVRLPFLGNLRIIDIYGDADIKGVAPVQLGPNQDFYLSQGSGSLTLPPWITSLAGLIGINRADATLTSLRIGAVNAVPATIDLVNLYDLTLKDVRIRAGRKLVVGLPTEGDYLVGPYAAPQDGRIQFRFEGAGADVMLKSFWGLRIGLRADCEAARGNALLSVAVGQNVDPSIPALYENEPLEFPPVASGNLVGIVNAPYDCTFGEEHYNVGIAVGAIIPLAVKRNGSIMFTEASGALTLPAETVNRLLDSGVEYLEGWVDELNLVVEDGTLENTNVLPGGTEVPITYLQYDTPIVLSLPMDSTVTAGPFVPDQDAESMIVGLGSAAATLYFNGSGEPVQASCPKPEPDALLIDAPII